MLIHIHVEIINKEVLVCVDLLFIILMCSWFVCLSFPFIKSLHSKTFFFLFLQLDVCSLLFVESCAEFVFILLLKVSLKSFKIRYSDVVLWAGFVTSQLVWKPILVQYSIHTNVMWFSLLVLWKKHIRHYCSSI